MDRMGSVMAGGGPGSERGAGDRGVPGEEGEHIWRTLGHRRRCWRTEGGPDGRRGRRGRGGGGGVVAKTGSDFGWGKRTL